MATKTDIIAPGQKSAKRPRRSPVVVAQDVAVGAVGSTTGALAGVGDFASFSVTTLRSLPYTFTRYRKEMLRQLMDVAWGSGALLVGGGTVGVMILLSIAAGTSLGI